MSGVKSGKSKASTAAIVVIPRILKYVSIAMMRQVEEAAGGVVFVQHGDSLMQPEQRSHSVALCAKATYKVHPQAR